MKVTKYEHAALLIEKDGHRLVIDPGTFLASMGSPTDVVTVVITHEHGDHWTAERLDQLIAANPGIRILAPQGVADAAVGYPVEVVHGGDRVTIEPFDLRFFGEKHAQIHSSMPPVDNVGVLVDDALYYGGDSYTLPGVPVDTLAVPIGAPWLKIGEAIDYALAVAPKRAFPTHDGTLSQPGKEIGGAHMKRLLATIGADYVVLEPGDSLEL